MARDDSSRRDVLKGLGGLAGLGALQWLGCNGGDGGNGNANGGNGDGAGGNGAPGGGDGQVVVRHDVMSPEGQAMLDSYRRAIEVMQGRPDSDPTSWRAQAQIHLDWCPHGNAYFLPWHRAYLHYFEQVVRAAAEDPSFALPYWDWTTHPTLPPAFWEGVLNNTTRTIQPDEAIPDRYVGSRVIDGILDIEDFQTFASAYVTDECRQASPGTEEQRVRCGTGQLEGTPHNNVHGLVGGEMGTFWSPLDPIFWLHHCRVDQLWAQWNLRHANGSDATWRGFEFQGNFVDPAGQPQNIRVDQTFDTTALGYRYDSIPEARPEGAAVSTDTEVLVSVETGNTETALPGSTIRVPVRLTDEVLRALPGAPGPESGGARSVRLTLGGLEPTPVPVPISVYVGGEGPQTGGPGNPRYAGTFGFFPIGGEGHGAHGPQSFLFDISEEVSGVEAGDTLDVHVEVEQPARAVPEGATLSLTPSLVRVEVLGQGATA